MEELTNAIKDTVSVLYWYEELSSSQLAIFGTVLRNFFLWPINFPLPCVAPDLWGLVGGFWTAPTSVKFDHLT